jgi:hypothetical protein
LNTWTRGFERVSTICLFTDVCGNQWLALLISNSITELPPGTQILGITPSGASYWARTAKIDATDEEGNPTPFFIKVILFPVLTADPYSHPSIGPPV